MIVRLMSMTAAVLLSYSVGSDAADASAGKAKAEAQCADCHEAAEWEGEDVASLGAKLKDVVTGKTKHKPALKLTDDEIASIAAYWSGHGK